jgi:methionyl-tRNA synthetase
MLMAAGVDVPKGVFAHGWLLVGGEKMSKSKLTGIAPTEITDVFGSDAYRFYFLSAIAFGQDGSFSWEDLAARYQAELANGFGNLASRTTAMIEKYFEGVVPPPAEYSEKDLEIQRIVADAAKNADAAIEQFRIDEAIAAIWTIVDALNGYITENEPWALARDEDQRERLGTVLYTCAEGLRALAVLLSPVMPQSTEKLWVALGAAETLGRLQDQPIREAGGWGVLRPGTSVNGLAPLFPRVESAA